MDQRISFISAFGLAFTLLPFTLLPFILLPMVACAESDSTTSDPLELRRHVAFLASDDLLGREAGEPGVARAEDYIAQAFKSSGLAPLPGQSDFFVPFTLFRQGFDPEATTLQVTADGERHNARAGRDFRPFFFSAEGTREAQVVFAGYGITAPEYQYDDYKDLDVAGRFVLIFRHEPGESDPNSLFNGAENSPHANFTTKAQNALQHGAAGMILVTDPTHREPDDLRLQASLRLRATGRDIWQANPGEAPFLAIHASRDLAEKLTRARGLSLAKLHRALEAGTPASEFALGNVTSRLSVARRGAPEEVSARNVAGFLEGSDAEFKDQWIVIGGHHDHEGGYIGDGDTVFNGADDNASGTSAVLALARIFARAPKAPARSLVFATFSAEEKGLLGSRALLKDPALPISKLAFMLNLDMIGRNSHAPVQVYGDGYVAGLREIVEQRNETVGLDLTFAGTGYTGNSDHDPFYRRDIPFMYFFTGLHEDYHQLGDHAEKLDYPRMEDIVRLASDVVSHIATQAAAPTFIHNVDWLGARLQVQERGGRRVAELSVVAEGSRAAAAGLAVGDILTALDHGALEDPDQVGQRFRAIEPGDSTQLTVRRGENKLQVIVERARIGYLGVVPGRVDDDLRRTHGFPGNEGILLRDVRAGSPAARSGLQDSDVLLRISGRPVSLSGLGSRLQQIGAGETVEMTILRGDKRKKIAVTLGERPRDE